MDHITKTETILICNNFRPNGNSVSITTLTHLHSREGVNREKLTVKKIVNHEMFFFTVYVPYKP